MKNKVKAWILSLTLIALVGVAKFAAGIGHAAGQERATETARLLLQPCRVAEVNGEARCGMYEVYEDRRARSGRKLKLKVVVLPALGQRPLSDPVFVLHGGPGGAATTLASFAAENFAPLRRERDIVLVDQRGTGGSNPLNCDLYPSLSAALGDLFPVDAIRACRAQLEPQADLRLYTTPIAMDDLDDVRAALGYERINLYGASYGTRAAQVYIQRHPAHVRSMILVAVAAMDYMTSLPFAREGQRAMDLLLDRCAADEACRAAFPKLREEFKTVLDRLASSPGKTQVLDPFTNKLAAVEVSRGVFASTLHYSLYVPATASQIPQFIHQAHENNFRPIARETLRFRRELAGMVSFGMFLSVTCAEDAPLIDLKVAAREANGTFLGDYWAQQLARACELWPRGELPRGYRTPVKSDTPVLLLSGRLDPVTPPKWAEEVAQHLPNSLHVVIPQGSHFFVDPAGCVNNVMVEFIKQGSVKGINTSCVGNLPQTPFIISSK